MVSSHCVGQTKPSDDFGKSCVTLADFAVRHADQRHLDLQIGHLPRRRRRALFVAGDDQHVGLERLHLGEEAGDVVQILRHAVVDRRGHLVFLHLVDHALAHVEREGVVLIDHGDLDLGRILARLLGDVGRHVDHRRQIFLGGRDDAEMILVALREQRARGRFALHQRGLVLLDHRQDRLGQRRAVGAEHVLDLVLVDQTLDQLRGARRRRFVVVIFDREVIALAADLHAAGVVDLLDRELVAVLGVLAVGGVDAGRRHRGAELDRAAGLRLHGNGSKGEAAAAAAKAIPARLSMF